MLLKGWLLRDKPWKVWRSIAQEKVRLLFGYRAGLFVAPQAAADLKVVGRSVDEPDKKLENEMKAVCPNPRKCLGEKKVNCDGC